MIDTTPTWRMVVSPAKGTFHLAAEAVERDVLAARRRDRRGRQPARPHRHHGAARRPIVEWLVEDGDLVSPGQPLLRLHPEGGTH